MLQFRLLGIPVYIHPFFWVILAIFGGAFEVLGQFTQQGLVNMIVFIVAGALSILVHEFGHALMMKKFGHYPEVIISTLGGVAVSSGPSFTKTQSILVTLMGPIAQFTLGLIAAGIAYIAAMQGGYPTPQAAHFVQSLMLVSFVWSIFNMIPIFPMDGGQILGALLGNHRRRILHITSITIASLVIVALLALQLFFLFALAILAMMIMDNVRALKSTPR